tara:strand:+ start:2163 stop:3038 length:876 start_codon:yes stop_codon:yes gene_type:complete
MGIFTKKDTNTLTGEDKFKGMGNTKTKVFESERQKGAVTSAAGGDLKGKDFRELKRDVHKQKRLNRRALRKAKRKGIDPSEVQMKRGSYKELSRREQDIEQYFKDVRKERVENTAEIALIATGAVLTGGAILGAGAGGGGAATAGAAAGAGGGTSATSGLLTALNAVPVAGTTAGTAGTAAATTAGTTAATTGIKAGLKEAGKQAIKNVGKDIAQGAIDNATSGGAQGGFQPDPRVAQMEQQLAMMQNQMNFMQEGAFQVPDYQPQQPFTMPPPIAQPSYTAASVYDPFLM